MAAIEIEGQKINRGNFWFVSNVTGYENLEKVFYDMEKKFYTDRDAFVAKMRIALEGFAVNEYIRLYPEDGNIDDKKDVKNKMHVRLNNMKSENSYADKVSGEIKLFYILRCCNENGFEKFKNVLKKKESYKRNPKNHNDLNLKDLYYLILDFYTFSSQGHHYDDSDAIEDQTVVNTSNIFYEVNEKNCQKYLNLLYEFFKAYCELYYPDAMEYKKMSLRETLIPIDDYIPIPEKTRELLKLRKLTGKKYYIKADEQKIKYYLILDADQTQKREIDVLKKIWSDDNDSEPSNIIRFDREIEVNKSFKKLIFRMPSKPIQLSEVDLQEISSTEKKKIFHDAKRAILTLHENDPSFYHRDITPESFAICKVKENKYKLFLTEFICTKDNDKNVDYTVVAKVFDNAKLERKRPYIAPEIYAAIEKYKYQDRIQKEWEKADWRKADIYSLGMLGMFIFTGGTDKDAFECSTEIDEEIKREIKVMYDERKSSS